MNEKPSFPQIRDLCHDNLDAFIDIDDGFKLHRLTNKKAAEAQASAAFLFVNPL